MNSIQQARQREQVYHDKLYTSHQLGEPGTWLHRPAQYATKSFDLIPKRPHIRALDLGAGIGRHTLPLANYLGNTGHIDALDLLDSAIDKLRANAKQIEAKDRITTIVTDIETYPLKHTYDYVLSVSCIEHISSKPRLIDYIKILQGATNPDGVHCFMIITDNVWVNTVTDQTLTPILEQNLNSKETIAMLKELYAQWHIHDISTKAWQVTEEDNGDSVLFKSTCVQFTASKI